MQKVDCYQPFGKECHSIRRNFLIISMKVTWNRVKNNSRIVIDENFPRSFIFNCLVHIQHIIIFVSHLQKVKNFITPIPVLFAYQRPTVSQNSYILTNLPLIGNNKLYYNTITSSTKTDIVPYPLNNIQTPYIFNFKQKFFTMYTHIAYHIRT